MKTKGLKITAMEKILLHLDKFERFRDHIEVPSAMTQEGIAKTIGVVQRTVSTIVRKLIEEDLIYEKMCHIQGRNRRIKAYFLTESGIKEVHPFKKRLEMSQYIDFANQAPQLKNFFGREAEFEEFGDWSKSESSRMLVVSGIAGIGKTTFVANVVEPLRDSMHIFWHRFNEWSTLRSFLTRLGDFLSETGSEKLSANLRARETIDINEISMILTNELEFLNALFVIDDYHKVKDKKAIGHMFGALRQLIENIDGTKIIVIGREVPRLFYDERELSIKKTVKELGLGGLDRESGLKLLEERGIVENKREWLYDITMGHPLTLELIHDTESFKTQDEIKNFMRNEIFSLLTPQERIILEIASVFRFPIYPTAYLDIAKATQIKGDSEESSRALVPPEKTEEIYHEVIDSLVKKSLLQESGGVCDIHDLIKEFIYDRLPKHLKKKYHEEIAIYYRKEMGETAQSIIEEQYHLLASENHKGVCAAILQTYKEVMKGPFWPELLNNIEKISIDAIDKEDLPKILLIKGILYFFNSELEKALVVLDQSIEHFEMDSNKSGMAEAQMYKGNVYFNKAHWDKALESYTKSLTICETTGDLKGFGNALVGIGNVHNRTSEFNKAEKTYKKALEYFAKVKDKERIAATEGNLGWLMGNVGKYDEAIKYSKKALMTFERLGDKHLIPSWLLNNIGWFYINIGDYDEAIKWLKKAIALATELSDMTNYFYASDSLVELYAKRGNKGDLDRGFDICKKIESIVFQLDDQRNIGFLYERKGILYGKKGDLKNSVEYFQKSMEIFKNQNVPKEMAANHLKYGQMLAENDKDHMAKKQFEKCIILSKKIGLSERVKEAKEEIEKLSRE